MAEFLVRCDGPVGTVILSNPDKHNPTTMQMSVPEHIAGLGADPAIRALLVGDDDKAFASGADISQFGTQRTDPADQEL